MRKLDHKKIDSFFQTSRLNVRKWRTEDVDYMVMGLNKYSVARGFNIQLPYTKENALKYILKTQEEGRNSIYFALELRGTTEVIGGGGIYYKNNMHSVGIWIRESDQGKGYGKEVLLGAADYVFDILNEDCVYAFFKKWNEHSRKLCESCHFTFIEAGQSIVESEENKECIALYTRKMRDEIVENS